MDRISFVDCFLTHDLSAVLCLASFDPVALQASITALEAHVKQLVSFCSAKYLYIFLYCVCHVRKPAQRVLHDIKHARNSLYYNSMLSRRYSEEAVVSSHTFSCHCVIFHFVFLSINLAKWELNNRVRSSTTPCISFMLAMQARVYPLWKRLELHS